MLGSNVVSVKALRTLVGKAQSMTSLLYTWMPFVYMLYAVIQSDTIGQAPLGCRWTKQAQVPLRWLQAFLAKQSGNLSRRISLDSYLRRGPFVCITTDASPFGLGAILEIGGDLIAWFGIPVNQTDRSILELDPSPQQVISKYSRLW